LKVVSADFVTSASATGSALPRDGLPQVALAGRSNVGKSSLINALARRKIARTSAAPGKTRLVNVYRIEVEGAGGPGRISLYLVDLPGYGYARGGADAAAELKAAAEAYLSGSERLRPDQPPPRLRQSAGALAKAGRGAKPSSDPSRASGSSRATSRDESERGWGPASAEKGTRSAGISRKPEAALLLVDARHPGLEADIQAASWLAAIGVEIRIVATKIDKLTRSERARNLKAIGDTFGTAAQPVSSASGEGLDELWRTIVTIARDADRDG
jgi:GTP-binding protein EngB required for normal cell division